MKRRLPLTELWQERDLLIERHDAARTLVESLLADMDLVSRRLEAVERDIERERGAA